MRPVRPTRKSAIPETLRQAQTWDGNANRYRLAGDSDPAAS